LRNPGQERTHREKQPGDNQNKDPDMKCKLAICLLVLGGQLLWQAKAAAAFKLTIAPGFNIECQGANNVYFGGLFGGGSGPARGYGEADSAFYARPYGMNPQAYYAQNPSSVYAQPYPQNYQGTPVAQPVSYSQSYGQPAYPYLWPYAYPYAYPSAMPNAYYGFGR
jgi:hypothetical protein